MTNNIKISNKVSNKMQNSKHTTTIWNRFFRLSTGFQGLLTILMCLLFVIVYGFLLYGSEFDLISRLKRGVFDFYTVLTFAIIFPISLWTFRSYAVLSILSLIALFIKVFVHAYACKMIMTPVFSGSHMICNGGNFTLFGWLDVSINELTILSIVAMFLYFKKKSIGEVNA